MTEAAPIAAVDLDTAVVPRAPARLAPTELEAVREVDLNAAVPLREPAELALIAG